MMGKIIFVSLVIVHCSFSQWSTSTKAESALYVCPGFNQGILTFDDGSSIIYGALSDYLYIQKLDPYGYKIWTQPVEVYNTPGTNNNGGVEMISDGSGGVYLWWADFRGAELGQFGYFNNAVYMQHVDKNGQKKWQEGGIQIVPVDGGGKWGYGTTDGNEGIIFYMGESDFLRTGASKKERTWSVGYNAYGQKKWEHSIDSTTIQYQLYSSQPVKFGNKIMIRTQYGAKFIDPATGDYQTPPTYIPNGEIIQLRDSIAFVVESKGYEESSGIIHHRFGITQMNSNWDSLWYAEYTIDDEGDGTTFGGPANGANIVDQTGGLFSVFSYIDKNQAKVTRAQWTTKEDTRWETGGKKFENKMVKAIFSGKNKLGMYFNNNTAQIYDTLGNAIWDSNAVVIADPENVYTPYYASDNNGGGIVIFWTVAGGIFAMHTGRTGRVGEITKITMKENIPLEFALGQNYPNPFNPTTTISYSIPEPNMVKLIVYDYIGREVMTLVDEYKNEGKYDAVFNASILSSGVYFYRLQSGNNVSVKKMVLLK